MSRALPLPAKWIYTAFVAVLVPVYTASHGLVNFLWFSNVALLGGLAAAWLDHRRLASMLLVAVGLLELGWLVDFSIGLARGGEEAFGLTAYMFDADNPLFVRLLSLYHIPLPFVLFWMAWRLRYDTGAWKAWLPIGWAILVVTFFAATPEQNVNWVYGGAGEPQDLIPDWAWLLVVMALLTFAWWVSHRVFEAIFGRYDRLA